MLFIGICGASGSGKSTLAEELATMRQQEHPHHQSGRLLQGPSGSEL